MDVLEKLLLQRGYFTVNHDTIEASPTTMLLSHDGDPTRLLRRFRDSSRHGFLFSSHFAARRHCLFRSSIAFALVVVAFCLPRVGLLISLFGSIGSSMLAVMVPPILIMTLERQVKVRDSRPRWWYLVHLAIVLCGFVGMVTGFIAALLEIHQTIV